MMKLIQNLSLKFKLPGIFFACLLVISGCSIDSLDSTSETLSDDELQIASQIIGESLSDQNDGIFSSLNDAFIIPTQGNFEPQSSQDQESMVGLKSISMSADDNSGRGNEDNYNYTYDSDSGTHTVSFNRDIQNENMTKETSVELNYIYFDQNGGFIDDPELDHDLIQTIDYSAERSGSVVTPRKNSSYERSDQFLIDGLSSGSTTLQIDGTHTGSGSFEVTTGNGNVVHREYTLTVDFLDVTIQNESTSENKTLEKGVTGALAYEMVINRNVNGDEDTKTINGTIEFNGDGTALLRFTDAFDDFRIKIDDGDVFDDNEFEGFVRSVDHENNAITLYNDQQILITSETNIDSESDLHTLQEVQDVLDRNVRVEAEGHITRDGDGNLIASEIKFEFEEEDFEFKGMVSSVDLDAGTFTLESGTTYFITEETEIDEDGDFSSLEEVERTLANGIDVKAEGEFAFLDDENFLAESVEFEEKKGRQERDFEGIVQSVHPNMRSFDLNNGQTIQITGRTEIEGDLNSLEEVAEALDNGARVEAEGKYINNSDNRLVATEIEFELDEDGDDDGDDGDDEEEEEEDDLEEQDFEGFVQSVDNASKSFTLTNGLTIHLTNDTELEGDFNSLGQLGGALNQGRTVEAEGEYFIDSDGRNIAIEVEFEAEEQDDDDNDEDEDDEEEPEEQDFEGILQSANSTDGSLTLTNGLTLFINNDTEIEGDFNTLDEVENALNQGMTIETEGEYFTQTDGTNIAIEIEFEAGQEEDPEEQDFEGIVQSVNTTGGSLTLTDGLTLLIDGDTEIDGDLLSLDEVDTALNQGSIIEAEGEYFVQQDGTNVAIEVEFEVEEEEDEDDEDDDDDDEEEEDEDDEDDDDED